MKNRVWTSLVIVLGILLIIDISCRKDDDTPSLVYGSVKDIDGNVYKTIIIGTQTWMAENLKTTRYRNGDRIGTTSPFSLSISSQSNPKYQWQVGEEHDTYGRLYTWYTLTDYRNLCPAGWHIPTDEEWAVLQEYLGGESIAGGKLKETGYTHWLRPNKNANNETGFTAIPSGCRTAWGEFVFIGSIGSWWTSTGYYTNDAMFRILACDEGILYSYSFPKSFGLAVRCVKD